MELSPSSVRYLLAIHALSASGVAVRSVDIAKRPDVTPSSVVHMLGILCRQGLTQKRHYGSVYLTASGLQLARRLSGQLIALEHFFNSHLQVSPAIAQADALACLCSLSPDSLEQIQNMYTHPDGMTSSLPRSVPSISWPMAETTGLHCLADRWFVCLLKL